MDDHSAERLSGGRTGGAVRVGDTVRRPARPWTPAVHTVLDHLQRRGFQGAPRPMGLDELGREVLSYLPGETVGDTLPFPAWARLPETLQQVGAWLRRLHDATEDFVPPDGARWFAGQGWQPGLVIGHHDAAPYNAVWDGRLVGFVDWDTAGPSPRELDLAFSALAWVPLLPARMAEAMGFPPSTDRRARLHLLLDAYGFEGDRAAFGAAVEGRALLNAEGIRSRAATGDPTYLALLTVAEDFEQAAREVALLPQAFWERPSA